MILAISQRMRRATVVSNIQYANQSDREFSIEQRSTTLFRPRSRITSTQILPPDGSNLQSTFGSARRQSAANDLFKLFRL